MPKSPADEAPIRFGTSGWRGIVGEEVTPLRAGALARAVGQWLASTEPAGRKRILVGHDTRPLGPELAAAAVPVLAGCGVEVLPVVSPVPTPLVTHAVARGRAEAALLFTASHNAPEYHGAKVISSLGGGAAPADTDRIEALAAAALRADPPPERSVEAAPVDLFPPYLEALGDVLDRDALAGGGLHVVYDALHGTGAGVLDRALQHFGVRVDVLRGERDPEFGGGAPDPSPRRLQDLSRAVRALTGPRLGLATDGDADRYAAVDADGRILSETECVALLVDHLARSGRLDGDVAISIATGSLVERVASHYGVGVSRYPIGFKYFTAAFAAGEAVVAGEESGGFAWDRLGRDKDGILAACLLAEIVAGTGLPLTARLRELEARHGASACGRIARPARPSTAARLAELLATPPTTFDGATVISVGSSDGLRLALADGFVMLRASGTEPVLRVYAEAPDADALQRRFEAGLRVLGA